MNAERMEHNCPICGKDVAEPTWERFAKSCCSEAHAEAPLEEVRARRQAAEAPPVRRSMEEAEPGRFSWGGDRWRGGS